MGTDIKLILRYDTKLSPHRAVMATSLALGEVNHLLVGVEGVVEAHMQGEQCRKIIQYTKTNI